MTTPASPRRESRRFRRVSSSLRVYIYPPPPLPPLSLTPLRIFSTPEKTGNVAFSLECSPDGERRAMVVISRTNCTGNVTPGDASERFSLRLPTGRYARYMR